MQVASCNGYFVGFACCRSGFQFGAHVIIHRIDDLVLGWFCPLFHTLEFTVQKSTLGIMATHI